MPRFSASLRASIIAAASSPCAALSEFAEVSEARPGEAIASRIARMLIVVSISIRLKPAALRAVQSGEGRAGRTAGSEVFASHVSFSAAPPRT